MKTVLFVCTGNTCRSPMAEVMFNEMLDEYPRLRELGFQAESAGTFAREDAPMNETAERTLEYLNFPKTKHKARAFTEEMAKEVDLILGVQEVIVEEILALAPEAEDYAHTLGGYAHGADGLSGIEYDIPDPYNQSLEVYMECALAIKEDLHKVMQRLEKEST